jgi:hypothetical protein
MGNPRNEIHTRIPPKVENRGLDVLGIVRRDVGGFDLDDVPLVADPCDGRDPCLFRGTFELFEKTIFLPGIAAVDLKVNTPDCRAMDTARQGGNDRSNEGGIHGTYYKLDGFEINRLIFALAFL